MSADSFVDCLRRLREAEHADGEKPEELLGEDMVTDAALGSESFTVVGEVVAGADNHLNPVLGVRGYEVEERLTGKFDALLDAFGVSHPFAGVTSVLVEGVEAALTFIMRSSRIMHSR